MKKALLAGIAALLLATGAAHAAEDTRKWAWRCSFPHTPSDTMTRFFIASVAALSVLNASAAHAYPPRYYNCGKAFVKIQTFHGSAAHGRVFPTVWTISENWEKEDREKLSPISSLNFRCSKDDKCWLNGNRWNYARWQAVPSCRRMMSK